MWRFAIACMCVTMYNGTMVKLVSFTQCTVYSVQTNRLGRGGVWLGSVHLSCVVGTPWRVMGVRPVPVLALLIPHCQCVTVH